MVYFDRESLLFLTLTERENFENSFRKNRNNYNLRTKSG